MIVSNFVSLLCQISILSQSLSQGAFEVPPGRAVMGGNHLGVWGESCHLVRQPSLPSHCALTFLFPIRPSLEHKIPFHDLNLGISDLNHRRFGVGEKGEVLTPDSQFSCLNTSRSLLTNWICVKTAPVLTSVQFGSYEMTYWSSEVGHWWNR